MVEVGMAREPAWISGEFRYNTLMLKKSTRCAMLMASIVLAVPLLAQEAEPYQAIDRHALLASKEAEKSPSSLAA